MKYNIKLYNADEYFEENFDDEEKLTDFLFDKFEDYFNLNFIEDTKNHKIYKLNYKFEDEYEDEARAYIKETLYFIIPDTVFHFTNNEYDKVAFITKNEN